ncbi:hypothetical protein NFI96_027350 [Prochilodus magdalenae]|nr:hypothetical protein NFI96_027350 [Prochilodus magdalenae]
MIICILLSWGQMFGRSAEALCLEVRRPPRSSSTMAHRKTFSLDYGSWQHGRHAAERGGPLSPGVNVDVPRPEDSSSSESGMISPVPVSRFQGSEPVGSILSRGIATSDLDLRAGGSFHNNGGRPLTPSSSEQEVEVEELGSGPSGSNLVPLGSSLAPSGSGLALASLAGERRVSQRERNRVKSVRRRQMRRERWRQREIQDNAQRSLFGNKWGSTVSRERDEACGEDPSERRDRITAGWFECGAPVLQRRVCGDNDSAALPVGCWMCEGGNYTGTLGAPQGRSNTSALNRHLAHKFSSYRTPDSSAPVLIPIFYFLLLLHPNPSHCTLLHPNPSHCIPLHPNPSHYIPLYPTASQSILLHPTTSQSILLHPTTSQSILLHPTTSQSILLHPNPSYCIPLHPNPSYCIPIHPTASHYIPIHPTASHYIPIHPTASQSIPLYPTASQSILLHPNPSHCTLLHPNPSYCIPLHPNPSHCTLLHPKPSHCTLLHPNPSYCISIHPTVPYCIPIHPTASHYIPIHPAASHYIPIHPAASQSIPLYPTASQSILLHPTTSQSILLHPNPSHCTLLHPNPSYCIPLHPNPSYCIPIHPTASHYIPIHPTASHYIPIHPTASHYIPIHPAASQSIPLYPTASQSILLHPTTSQSILLHPNPSHCTLLHPNPSHCIPLHPNPSHCTLLHPNPSYCIPIHPTVPYCIPIHPTASQSIPLYLTASQSISLHPTTSQSIPLYPTASQSILLHPTTSQSIPLAPQVTPPVAVMMMKTMRNVLGGIMKAVSVLFAWMSIFAPTCVTPVTMSSVSLACGPSPRTAPPALPVPCAGPPSLMSSSRKVGFRVSGLFVYFSELNHTARTFFPKEYLSRKQNFQKASCAKWPLPSCRKLFRIFGGFQRQSSPIARRQFPHGGYRLDALDFEDDSRGWRFDMDMVIIYIYSVNWVIGFIIFIFLCYCFFPSL